MIDEVLPLLKMHEYFHGVPDIWLAPPMTSRDATAGQSSAPKM